MNFLNRHFLLQITTYLILLELLQSTQCQIESPCPNIFEYRYDNNNNLYGYIKVPSPDDNVIRLNIQLSVGNRVQNYNGHIELAASRESTIQNILSTRPLQYNLYFPPWINIPPKITEIVVNERLLCSGAPISKFAVETLTTINLRHTLTLSILPSGGHRPPPIPDKSFPDRPQTIKPVRPQINNNDNFGNDWFTQALETTTKRQPPLVTKPNAQIDMCGLSSTTHALVFNGEVSTQGAHPWLGALFAQKTDGLKFMCGTTLISKKHIITAAHCVQMRRKRYRADELWVVLGRENIQRWSNDGAQIIQAETIYVHPDYKFTSADGDIALVALTEDAIFSSFIRPACLWRGNTDVRSLIQTTGVVVGWGKDETGRQVTSQPRQITLPIVSEEECLRSNVAFRDITSNRTFCAGYRNNSGPCNGDSGGGFLIQVGDRWTLRGVISMSIAKPDSSCDLNEYVVFADVALHMQWLLSYLPD